MLKYIFTFFILSVFLSAFQSTAQAPPILWQKTIGGFDDDILSGTDALDNGGIMLSGFSKSGASGNKKDTSRGGYDFWLVKLNEKGDIAWEKTYGGFADDTSCKVMKTASGGYLLAGTSLSQKSGDKALPTWYFSPDYWVLILDKNGQVLVQTNLGGYFTEKLTGIAETDYGYAISGHSYSDHSGSKETDNTGTENNADYWMVFLEKTGRIKKTLAFGTKDSEFSCCILSSNAGNIIGGSSYANSQRGQKTRNTYGGSDFWVIRTDLSGTKIYDSTMGGSQFDYMTCSNALHDGNLILGGYSNSPISGVKTEDCRGVYDYWVIKMNVDGKIIWQKTLGGSEGDYMTSVQETHDGGFIVGGYSNSNISGEKSEASKGGNDYWIVKLDSLGNKQWDKTIGGSGDDKLISVSEYAEGEYILNGYSNSPASGDKDSGTVGGTGKYDYWIVRLGKGLTDTTTDSTTPPPPIDTAITKGNYILNIIPNPTVNGNLTIQFSSTDNEMTPFVLHSYDGKKVLSFSYNATKELQTKSVSIAKLQKGVYYLTMYTKQKKVTKMVIKQ